MSASCKMPWWKWWLVKLMPCLFRECMGFNKHWRWDRVCYCVNRENGHGIMLRLRGNRWLDTQQFTDYEHIPR